MSDPYYMEKARSFLDRYSKRRLHGLWRQERNAPRGRRRLNRPSNRAV